MPKAYPCCHVYTYKNIHPHPLRSRAAFVNCRRRGCEVVVPAEKWARRSTRSITDSSRASHDIKYRPRRFLPFNPDFQPELHAVAGDDGVVYYAATQQ
eukprot:2904012-Amphidinium_carterae.1